MIQQKSKATHVHVESQVCLQSFHKILNKEVPRYRNVIIESLAMQMCLDSDEVCVKLDNGLIKTVISSIYLSDLNF